MHTRRSFLGLTVTALATLPFLQLGKLAQAATPLPPMKETEPQAKALKYCANANKPSPNCKERKDPKKKDQFCHNCQLFKKTEEKAGTCMIMPKNSVAADGWCMSWVKMPGA